MYTTCTLKLRERKRLEDIENYMISFYRKVHSAVQPTESSDKSIEGEKFSLI